MITFTHVLILLRYSNFIKIESSAVVAPCKANLADSGIVEALITVSYIFAA